MINSTRHENQDEVSSSACSKALNPQKPVTGVEYTPELFIPLSLVLSLVTFSGNLLIFLVLHKVSSIHPPSRVLFRCLLITDLCVGLFSQPLFVGFLMAVKEKNRSLCSKTEGLALAVSTVLCGQSITKLTIVSVDRLLALWLGIRYRQVVTLPRVRLSVTILWVANFAFTITYYWNKPVFFLWGCGYIFTCLIISTCCYFKIYLVLGYCHVKIQPLSQGISASRSPANKPCTNSGHKSSCPVSIKYKPVQKDSFQCHLGSFHFSNMLSAVHRCNCSYSFARRTSLWDSLQIVGEYYRNTSFL